MKEIKNIAEKQLLTADLCARLPYEPKALTEGKIVTIRTISINPNNDEPVHIECWYHYRYFYKTLGEIKPYLFPLSSMTEKQREEYYNICWKDWIDNKAKDICGTEILSKCFDYLNEHHFDYRGLIGMRLAIDATGLNIY